MTPYKQARREWQRRYFLEAARQCRSMSELASKVDVNRTDLYKLIERCGLTVADFRKQNPQWTRPGYKPRPGQQKRNTECNDSLSRW